MAIVTKRVGDRPNGVMTTRGWRKRRPMLCMECGERKHGVFTINANGKEVCPDCGPANARDLLRYEPDES